jgi:predicted DNA-binding helix-hairpin-helix protein
MDTLRKLDSLGAGAQYDLCGASGAGCGADRKRASLNDWIYPAMLPGGKAIRLLKVLQTNACQNDCSYCPTRVSARVQRISFAPEELAAFFMDMLNRGLVSGLFLSSGIAGGAPHTMDRLLATSEIVRRRYGFLGYLHLKIMPGAEFAQVEAAVRLADRVSLNLEAPTADSLARIAGKKDFEDGLLARMGWIHQLTSQGLGASGGQTTQFVVGAAGESDHEILSATSRLYRQIHLRRAYFSAFQPVPGSPLEEHPPTPKLRQQRLYQADFLFRKYGFQLNDLVFDDHGHLPLTTDPKLLWASRHPERFPLEINTASREELLRVPGIGPTAAARLLDLRRQGRLSRADDLRVAGATPHRALPYLLLDGRRAAPIQLSMF